MRGRTRDLQRFGNISKGKRGSGRDDPELQRSIGPSSVTPNGDDGGLISNVAEAAISFLARVMLVNGRREGSDQQPKQTEECQYASEWQRSSVARIHFSLIITGRRAETPAAGCRSGQDREVKTNTDKLVPVC